MSISGSYVFNLSGQPTQFLNYSSLLEEIGVPQKLVEENMKLTNVEIIDTTNGRLILNFGTHHGDVKCVENIRPGEPFEEKNFDGFSSNYCIWYRHDNTLTKHSKPMKSGSGIFYTMERKFVERKMVTTITCKQKKAVIVYFRV